MKKKIKKKAYSRSKVVKNTSSKTNIVSVNGGFRKQYLKSRPVCRVTFRLPKDAAPDAHIVTIIGDFNNWSPDETQMKRLKNGDFKLTLELPVSREYRFRYLIDGNRWENDWNADKYIPNRYGCDDSVVVV